MIKGETARRACATTTRPSARSSAPSPSSRATASAGATCGCSAPRPTARRRCCSRSSPRRCARATPSGARRRRGAREPRGGRDPPQAPAADPRPAQDRRVSGVVAVDLRARIRDIPDFPKPGIVFKDITPLLLDPARSTLAVGELAAWRGRARVDFVVAAEARGFILGGALARELGVGLRAGPQAGQAAARDGDAPSTCSSTGSTRSSCTPTRSRTARACSSTTTCSPPAAPRGPLCELVEQLGGAVVGLRVRGRAGLPQRPRAARPATTSTRFVSYDGEQLSACVPTTRQARTIARRARGRLGGRRRPAPPAALVAARAARGGRRRPTGWTKVLATGKGHRRCAPTTGRAPRRAAARRRWARSSRTRPSSGSSPRPMTEVALARGVGRRGHRGDARAAPAPARLVALRRVLLRARSARGARRGARRPGGDRGAERARDAVVGLGRPRPSAPTLPAHAVELPARGRSASPSARGPRSPSRTVRVGAPRLPAAARAAPGGGRRRRSTCATTARARVLHAAGKSYPDLVRQRAGDCEQRARRGRAARRPRRGGGRAGGVRGGRRRGRALRRRHERRRRRRAAARATTPPSSRSTSPAWPGSWRSTSVAHGACSRRACACPRPRRRCARGLHARPLPAELRVRDASAAAWRRARPGRRRPATGASTSSCSGCAAPRRSARSTCRRCPASAAGPGAARARRRLGGHAGRHHRGGAARRARARGRARYEGWFFRDFAEGAEALRRLEQRGRRARRRPPLRRGRDALVARAGRPGRR